MTSRLLTPNEVYGEPTKVYFFTWYINARLRVIQIVLLKYCSVYFLCCALPSSQRSCPVKIDFSIPKGPELHTSF